MLLKSFRRNVTASIAAACIAVSLAAPVGAQNSPFEGMTGSWSGTGTITLASGGREKINCRGDYKASGNSLGLNLSCTSDRYKFVVRGNAVLNGGTLSGQWSENTRSVVGSVSGRAIGGEIQAQVDSQVFTTAPMLNVTTKSGKQTITITAPGRELSSVVLTLAKK